MRWIETVENEQARDMALESLVGVPEQMQFKIVEVTRFVALCSDRCSCLVTALLVGVNLPRYSCLWGGAHSGSGDMTPNIV